MDYELGLEVLKQLAQGKDWYQDILPYETALLDRLYDERIHGLAPQTHQEMMRALNQLNRLAYQHLGISFTDLCQGKQAPLQARLTQYQSANDTLAHDANEQGSVPSTQLAKDVGIIIALKEEFRELFNEFAERHVSVQDAENNYYYLFERAGADPNRPYQCVATFVGGMGPLKAGLTAQTLINKWDPHVLVMLGIAGALSDDVKIGDVVVASQVDAYMENSKAVEALNPDGYTFVLSGEVYPCSVDLLRSVRNFEFVHRKSFADWQEQCKIERQEVLPRERLERLLARGLLRDLAQFTDGHIASGSTVGGAQAFTNWLKKVRDRNYLAIEMEAVGLMEAAYEKVNPQRTLILRAISDYADKRKTSLDKLGKGAFRRYAMHNAIRLLWSFLDAGILPLRG